MRNILITFYSRQYANVCITLGALLSGNWKVAREFAIKANAHLEYVLDTQIPPDYAVGQVHWYAIIQIKLTLT